MSAARLRRISRFRQIASDEAGQAAGSAGPTDGAARAVWLMNILVPSALTAISRRETGRPWPHSLDKRPRLPCAHMDASEVACTTFAHHAKTVTKRIERLAPAQTIHAAQPY